MIPLKLDARMWTFKVNVISPSPYHHTEVDVDGWSAFQILQDKLNHMQTLLQSTVESCDSSWHALINEDRLLSKIEVLQNQLSVFSKVSVDRLLPPPIQSQRVSEYR